MSNYLYLRCENHNPPLRAEEESGQHLYDLPVIRADIREREALVAMYDHAGYLDVGDYFRNNTVKFLIKHRTCELGIESEYGDVYPLEAGAE